MNSKGHYRRRRVVSALECRLTPETWHSAGRSGDIAFRRFCTPALSERRSPDHEVLVRRARPFLARAEWRQVASVEGPIDTYSYLPDGPSRGRVLVAHGWTSEAAFMTLFAEQFRREGLGVVMFDSPGHGRNGRSTASIVDCARAVLAVADVLGPFDAAVGHSMGCVSMLLAGEGAPPLAHAYRFGRYVLVSPPNRFQEITDEFGRGLGLSAAAQRAFERHLARIARRPMSQLTTATMLAATGAPALVLHARDDAEVGFHNAEEIVAACAHARLQPLETGGHRKILSAPPVIRAATAFLKAS